MLYETGHSFVWEYGSDLIPLLDLKPGEKILDVGCGTGQLTDRIAETGATVVGIDSSESMVAQARVNFPAIEFRTRMCAPFDPRKNMMLCSRMPCCIGSTRAGPRLGRSPKRCAQAAGL